jgi:four helix bundle protein
MEKTNFENLEIYQVSESLSDKVWEIVLTWNHLAQDTIGKQLIRSTDSIGANIAEGSGRGSDQDYKRFLYMARGSLYETRHWLRRAFKRKLLSDEQIKFLTPLIEELTPKLNAYLGKIGTYKKLKNREK